MTWQLTLPLTDVAPPLVRHHLHDSLIRVNIIPVAEL